MEQATVDTIRARRGELAASLAASPGSRLRGVLRARTREAVGLLDADAEMGAGRDPQVSESDAWWGVIGHYFGTVLYMPEINGSFITPSTGPLPLRRFVGWPLDWHRLHDVGIYAAEADRPLVEWFERIAVELAGLAREYLRTVDPSLMPGLGGPGVDRVNLADWVALAVRLAERHPREVGCAVDSWLIRIDPSTGEGEFARRELLDAAAARADAFAGPIDADPELPAGVHLRVVLDDLRQLSVRALDKMLALPGRGAACHKEERACHVYGLAMEGKSDLEIERAIKRLRAVNHLWNALKGWSRKTLMDHAADYAKSHGLPAIPSRKAPSGKRPVTDARDGRKARA